MTAPPGLSEATLAQVERLVPDIAALLGITTDRARTWLLAAAATDLQPAPPPADELRPLPGDRATCDRCGSTIVWATTTARESGPGGKAMPLDPVENPDGNVAAWRGHGRRVLARVLLRDEQPDTPLEVRAMPHFATCRRNP